MFSWIDIVIAAVFIVVIIGEIRRGFGKALFDFGAMVLTLIITYKLVDPVSKSIAFSSQHDMNKAIAFGIVFAVLGVILFLLGKFLYETTLISLDVFDPLLGGILGIGVAIIISHAFAQDVALGTTVHGTSSVVMNSALGKELLTFETYKHILNSLYNFDK